MKKIVQYMVVILGVAVAGALALFLYMDTQWSAHQSGSGADRIVTIPYGSTLGSIADLLVEEGCVTDKFAFKLYSRWSRKAKQYKSGVYAIPLTASIKEVADILVLGKTVAIKVTIPEGRVSWEIIGILKEELPHLDSAVFDKLVYDPQFAEVLKVPSVSLEGYLYPDTYYFPYGANEKEVLTIMVKAFKKAFSQLLAHTSPVFKEYGLNGVVTFASIVEEEAGVKGERQRIAGVFYNRLKGNWSLGADPTVRYIHRNLTGPIYKSQLDSDSPFNTRKFRGLPPHAVSNPGKESLFAALFPAQSRDLYFVAKDDGSMEHYFSSSLKEHNRYKDSAAVNRRKRGMDF